MQFPRTLTKRQWIAAIFIAAAAVRLLLAYLIYPHHVYRGEAESIGMSLALHGEFAGCYAVPTGPTAHCGPFYTGLIAIVYYLLGTGFAAEMTRIGLLILVNSVICAAQPVMAAAVGLPLWCGIGSGLASALIPMHRTGEMFHAWDEPYAALGLMLALTLLARWTALCKQSIRVAAAYGVLWGVLLHIAPGMLLVFAGLSAYSILTQRRNGWTESRRWLVVWAVAGLVITPWTLRNRIQLGGWIFMRSNFGIELQMANNDRSGPATDDNRKAGLYRQTHPSINVQEAERVRSMGEIAYNRERLARATTWIKTHSLRFAELTVARVLIFWLGWWGNPESAWIFALTTALAAVGGWLMWRDGHRHTLAMFGIVWLCYPLTFYLVQHLPRYRMSIWWTVVLAAAYGAGRLAGKPAEAESRDSAASRPLVLSGRQKMAQQSRPSPPSHSGR
jgi:hypothetical protein